MGYDVHQLVKGRDLWLGGIKIEHNKGLLGHSDADVLIHAICDALLGAANLRDIGYHFPDTSADTEGMDSKVILKKTIELIATKGYHLVNIDATICAERPKMNPAHPCHATVHGRRHRLRCRRRQHQGHHDREAGLHRPPGGHLGLCRGTH